jgi:two-component system phosphate regulon response regulator PhoB
MSILLGMENPFTFGISFEMNKIMEKTRVLVIEDEKDINDLLSLQLSREGYEVDQAYEGTSGLNKAIHNSYHVLILDWMLPGVSGIDVLKQIREVKKSSELAIIMTTAKSHSDDSIRGLDLGADDYLTKPFDVAVLKARIKAVLRRLPMVSTSEKKILSVGGLVIDQSEHIVTCDEQKIDLTISEFKLLLSLVINEGKVLSRKALISEIQGDGVTVIDRSIDTHMVGLRKKIGSCSDLIKTVRGVGYKIEA